MFEDVRRVICRQWIGTFSFVGVKKIKIQGPSGDGKRNILQTVNQDFFLFPFQTIGSVGQWAKKYFIGMTWEGGQTNSTSSNIIWSSVNMLNLSGHSVYDVGWRQLYPVPGVQMMGERCPMKKYPKKKAWRLGIRPPLLASTTIKRSARAKWCQTYCRQKFKKQFQKVKR